MKKKQEYGYDMNLVIQRKKMFRNPSIYEKLIQFCEIDETGTNLPKDLYDGHLFGKESYYDELSKGWKIWKENLSCLLFFKRKATFFYSALASKMSQIKKLVMIQLNDYETAPNFIQLNQNLTSDCLSI